MSKAITGGITVNLMAGILVTVVTICGTALWMAEQHDKQAAEATQTMVSGGVDLTRRRLEAITNDYAWWDEAYDAFVREDAEWLDANIGTGITGTMIADALAILDLDGGIKYAWTVDEEEYVAENLYSPQIIAWAREVMEPVPVDRGAAQTLFAAEDGRILLVGTQRLTPPTRIEEISPDQMPLILFMQEMSAERLSDLGQQYLIPDLAIASGAVEEGMESANLLVDPSGRTIATLEWSAPHPGRDLLRKLTLPIAGALVAFAVVALGISLRARGLAVALFKSEMEAVTASRTDSLTGLLNRAGFIHHAMLPTQIEACKRGRMAVIYLDVNEFKIVNDTLGHLAGDHLVIALARRLEKVIPEGVYFARIGGDEFGVLMTGERLSVRVPELCNIFASIIEEPFEVLAQKLHAHCAIGYAISERGCQDPNEVVRRSDVAMYHAKAARERDGIAYDKAMEVGAEEKRQIEIVLRKSIPDGELAVQYQPILTSGSRKVEHLEALARWNSAELGRIGPDKFIPIAEQSGLIHDIGAFILDQVCRDMARWPEMTVCVNLSPVQLRDPSFIDQTMRILDAHGIDPHRIELELTEGVLVAVPTIARMRLTALKEKGFALALDDFGSGFSSIGYLEQFPFDNLKIDRSFVNELGKSAKGNALIHSLVTLGQAMGLSVTAEGVETEAQFDLLRSIRCTRMQGWLIGKPLPADETEVVLKNTAYFTGSEAAPTIAKPVIAASEIPIRKPAGRR